jgi:amphiphysin
VKASYKYQAEDVDELAFEIGELINVVEYDDPEEQVVSNRQSLYTTE